METSRTADLEILVWARNHYPAPGGTDVRTGFDLKTVFFNPKLLRERKRVTDQVQPGELVFVPFCGAGPFAIPAGFTARM